MINLNFIWFLIAIIFSSFIEARPVSYPGGLTLMLMNDTDKNSVHAHYSPTSHISLGYKFEYWRENQFTFNGIQMNNLIKRWNKPQSQANLYVKSAIGSAFSDKGKFENKNNISGFLGISTDWETQRYFIAYENRFTEAGKIDRFFMQSIHLGITPYIGNYGDLHTWIMIKATDSSGDNRGMDITPHFRFFKGIHLLEVGANLKGKAMLNYIYRY